MSILRPLGGQTYRFLPTDSYDLGPDEWHVSFLARIKPSPLALEFSMQLEVAAEFLYSLEALKLTLEAAIPII